MRRLALLLVLVAVGAPARADAADELPEALRRQFVATRDAEALLAAWPEELAEVGPWLDLARMAAGRAPGAMQGERQGLAALPAFVRALRELDLADAERAARRADRGGGVPGAWAYALVLLRRGDDAGAVGRILAPPLFTWAPDAFPLALLGASLNVHDRRTLAAGARAALARAAARLRIPAILATAHAAVALDPVSAPRALVLAVRALRRGRRYDAARELLAFAQRTGVAAAAPELALEAALTAWTVRDTERVPGLLGGAPPEGSQGVYLALRRAGRCPRPPEQTQPWRHAPGPLATADIAARVASAAGVPTSPGEVESWARRTGVNLGAERALRAALEARGLTVLESAGEPTAGDAALAAGLPFVLRRIGRTERGYEDIAAMVTGYDSCTGLWLLQQPDMRQIDVALRSDSTKARLLVAVSPTRSAVVAAVRGAPGIPTGERIAAALEQVERGDAPAAQRAFGDASASEGVLALYRAMAMQRLAAATSDAALRRSAEASAERSRRTPPLLGVEAFLRGQARGEADDAEGARAAFQQVERLEGSSADLLLSRFSVELAAGHPREALETLERAARVAPLDVRILFHRGTTRAALGDTWAGRADLKRALERRPTAVAVAAALAQLELRAYDPTVALEVLRDVIRHDPSLEDDPTLGAARRAAELELIRTAQTVEILATLRRSREVETRRRLAFALAERSAEADAAESLLRKLLADPDPGVRATTLRLYQRSWLRRRVEEDTVLLRRVVQLLVEDPSLDVRKVATGVLARAHVPVAARTLGGVLAGAGAAPEAALRAAAARALALHAGKEVLEVLVAALEDPDRGVRRAAIDSLFQLAATRLAFDPDGSPEARAAAVAAWRARLAED